MTQNSNSPRENSAPEFEGVASIDQILDLLEEARVELQDSLSRRKSTADKLEEIRRRISQLRAEAV